MRAKSSFIYPLTNVKYPKSSHNGRNISHTKVSPHRTYDAEFDIAAVMTSFYAESNRR